VTDFAALTAQLVGFDWDRGNTEKRWARHGVSRAEAEDWNCRQTRSMPTTVQLIRSGVGPTACGQPVREWKSWRKHATDNGRC
jgi:hypothetical protein